MIKTDHIGDFLLCLPAVRELLRGEPRAEVGFLVGSINGPLASRLPWVHEVHIWDSPRYSRSETPSPSFNLRAVLEGNWDLIVDLTNDPATATEALRRPSPYRRDVGTFRMLERLKRIVRLGAGLRGEHVARVFYQALELPVPETIHPEGTSLRDEDREEAERALKRGAGAQGPIAALHVGASWEFRRWPSARFQELARALESRGLHVFVVGGEAERAISQEVVSGAALPVERNLAGQTSLPATAAVLERASVVVANDGGLMHLAAAQGAPVVGIFGPTNPSLFGPLGERSRALYQKRDCSPCAQRHCVWGRSRCLEPIEVSQVLRAALEVAR